MHYGMTLKVICISVCAGCSK